MSGTRLDRVNAAAKALERIVREADKRGHRDGYLSQKEVFGLANAVRPKEMPETLWSLYTSSKARAETSIPKVIARVRAEKKAIKKADKNRNGTISPTERKAVKGLALSLLRETTRLPRFLKKVLAIDE